MTKRKTSIEQRLGQAESEMSELRAQLEELGATAEELAEMRDDVELLRGELAARGIANPGPPDLSPEGRIQRAKNVAKARASKDVGAGQGKVRTKAVQRKLQREAGVRKGRK